MYFLSSALSYRRLEILVGLLIVLLALAILLLIQVHVEHSPLFAATAIEYALIA